MKIFEIQPASNSILLVIIPISFVLVTIIVLILYAFISSKNAKFMISENYLEIKASLYSRKIPLSEIKKENIVLLNLSNDVNWSPKWRTNGIGLFGYNEGWFKLKNGNKGLLFLTKKDEVVLIPTTKNYYIIISPNNPVEFIKTLKQ